MIRKQVGDAADDPDFFESDDEEGVTSIRAKPEATRISDSTLYPKGWIIVTVMIWALKKKQS